MRVLVAEDSSTLLRMLKGYLEEWGYEVEAAADGGEAWNRLSVEDPPRIAILDWVMPVMDGVEICRKLRQQSDGPFIYVILVSVKDGEKDRRYALENGAHNYLPKPFSPEELRNVVGIAQGFVETDNALTCRGR